MTFNPDEPRGPGGKWTHFPSIHASDLSTPDARRSPEVTESEFQSYARRGAAKVAQLKAGATPPCALEGKSWESIKHDAYTKSRDPWGGVTVDSHTGKDVPDGLDAYALTVRDPGMPSVHVSPKASEEDFGKAMETAKARYAHILSRPNHHLGVFHDADTGNIDIDPVLVTPKLSDVHDIGAFTHAVGGAYHFKSGDGYWPPHVKEKEPAMALSFITPAVHNSEMDLAHQDGRLAFWKQILPKKTIHYTAKDGSRQVIDFNEQFLTDLANNRAVDKIGFLLADKDNAHTMDPERWRGEVTELAVRDDGLYGKIVFPNAEAAKAVIDNPNLGVSARIRPNVQRSDGSTVSSGIIHVLGTLDPQVSGMSPWQTADLSTEDEVLDLSDKEYEDMADKQEPRDLSEFTEADLDAMSDEELDEFLATYAGELFDYTDDVDENNEPEPKAEKREPVGASLSHEGSADIELANQRAEDATRRANEAMRRVAEAEWREERSAFLNAGVPPHALDLAAPVLCRADDMVIDLSVTGESDVNVSEVVRGLLDSLKGTVDLSSEQGHSGTFSASDGDDPDKAMLDAWANQF